MQLSGADMANVEYILVSNIIFHVSDIMYISLSGGGE
jgi:hypothetical protein